MTVVVRYTTYSPKIYIVEMKGCFYYVLVGNHFYSYNARRAEHKKRLPDMVEMLQAMIIKYRFFNVDLVAKLCDSCSETNSVAYVCIGELTCKSLHAASCVTGSTDFNRAKWSCIRCQHLWTKRRCRVFRWMIQMRSVHRCFARQRPPPRWG